MDNNVTRIDNNEIENAIEAILFAAGHPMSYSKLAEVLAIGEGAVKKRVKKFAEKYNEDKTKGIMLLTFETSCQLCTKEKYLPLIKDALGIRKGGNLSSSSLEVLAIIAYNEPTTRAFVDKVRKVDSAYVVSSLCEKGLIEACGRLDEPGRPHLYRTTETFLRCFGIESLEQLPYVDLPRGKNEGEIIPIEIPGVENEDDDSLPNEEDEIVSEDSSNEVLSEDDLDDLIDPDEEDDLLDPDEEDDEF